MPTISSNEIHVKYVLDTGQLQAATQAMSQITAEERKLLADLKKLQDQLNAAGRAGRGAGNDTASSFGKVGEVVKGLIPVLSVAFAVDKIKEFASYAFETAKQFEQMNKVLAFVAGSTDKANQQFAYMTALAQNMGLNVRALIDGYKGFAASAAFAGVSQENINRQMLAFTKAAAALAMSAEDTKLMFTALAQMYSKNKIQAEELRGQLGERLPGAMELLAKSMKVPVEALDEMLKKGEIITKDVMPAFAKEVEMSFALAADKTDTFTAAQNRLFTALETTVVRIMEGGIGDSIKWLLDRLAAISDLIKNLNQDALQNERDFQSKRLVEVEKNVLYEMDLLQKFYKEKYNMDLTAGEAAKKLLEDTKNGEAAYYDFLKKELKEIDESSKSIIDKTIRGAQKSFGTLADVVSSPVKFMGAALKDAFMIDGGGNVAKLYEDFFKARTDAINEGAVGDIKMMEARLKVLKYYAQEETRIKKEKDDDEAQKEGQAAKNRYQRELQMLELQEKIRRLYAQSSIENEFERGQAILKIGADFNEKKRAVDDKYYKESFKNESQAMKDLRELTNNNSNLRKAENASFYADIRRNEDEYHKQAYEAEKKALDKLQKERDKNADKLINKKEQTLDDEYNIIEQKYNEQIKAAVQNANNIIGNDALMEDKRKELLEQNYTLLNQLYDDKNKERNNAQKKHDDEFIKDMLKYLAEKEKLRKQDYENAKDALDAQSKLTETGLERGLLEEKNYYRFKKSNSQEMNLLEKKQAEERVEFKMNELDKRLKIEEQFYDIPGSEERQKQILADMRLLEEEKNSIQLDYAEKRAQYEIEVLQQSLDLANQMVGGLMELRQQQLDQQLQSLQSNAQEEIRLADGNKQQILVINQKLKDEEKRIRKEQFAAQQTAAVADVVFRTAPIIAQYAAGLVTGPLALIAAAAAATQIGFILAQKAPEYAKGTQGKPHKGGPAIVGEVGVEKVITESGKVYYTPPTATLLDLPKGSHVIPNHLLDKQEIYYATNANTSAPKAAQNKIETQLTEIGSILRGLPIHQIHMNERGFEKFVRTEKRTTKILNNSFPTKSHSK